ncbi:MAG TPA: CoB--CoM heterodisulfide reductase iron-sulfur subunit B family protein [Thermoplasmata archaeon]|nr:CoB--CoM heterodisulfide reductase iron-sulfur subunit B family protein [Thermoplasmata archaeon]
MIAARAPIDAVPAYYPGCSLDGLGSPYEVSARQVLARLGLSVDRIVDFNCCGATEVKSLSGDVAVALPARNLALAQSMGRHQVVAACNGCVYSLARANHAVNDRGTRQRVNELLNRGGAPSYDGGVSVQHLLPFVYERAGPDRVRAAVRHPLTGVTVAPYYGCLYTRPKSYTGAGKLPGTDNPEFPHFLDELLAACGANVVRDFSAKTLCCGGGHALSDLKVSVAFCASILDEARRAGADIVATICPLGQVNIENHFERVRDQYGEELLRPVAYFTQLMSLAFGSTLREARLGNNFTRPDRFFRSRGYS